MAIDAYTGLPRSGKSYSVVKNVILPSLRQKRHVYTNIPLTQIAHDEFPGQIHQLEKERLPLFNLQRLGAEYFIDQGIALHADLRCQPGVAAGIPDREALQKGAGVL